MSAPELTLADIDALERLHAEATGRPWRSEWHFNATHRVLSDAGDGVFVGVIGDPQPGDECLSKRFAVAERNARAIAALHNAAPALLALARDGLAMRALREECAGCEDEGALGIIVACHLAAGEPQR